LHYKAQQAYQRADGVSSVSEAYNTIIKRKDLKVFPLGMKLPENLGYETKSDVLRLCYVGNLGSGYCLEAVLSGMEQLIKNKKSVQLTVAGDGPKRGLIEKYRSIRKSIIRDLWITMAWT
jgi:hypothetical protein